MLAARVSTASFEPVTKSRALSQTTTCGVDVNGVANTMGMLRGGGCSVFTMSKPTVPCWALGPQRAGSRKVQVALSGARGVVRAKVVCMLSMGAWERATLIPVLRGPIRREVKPVRSVVDGEDGNSYVRGVVPVRENLPTMPGTMAGAGAGAAHGQPRV